jgi:hypothetical protein
MDSFDRNMERNAVQTPESDVLFTNQTDLFLADSDSSVYQHFAQYSQFVSPYVCDWGGDYGNSNGVAFQRFDAENQEGVVAELDLLDLTFPNWNQTPADPATLQPVEEPNVSVNYESGLRDMKRSAKRRHVSREEWERHYDTINSLYHSHKLAEVQAILQRQSGFEARSVNRRCFLRDQFTNAVCSTKQWKTIIGEWQEVGKLPTKNFQRKVQEDISTICAKRARDGKDTKVYYRGRSVSPKRIEKIKQRFPRERDIEDLGGNIIIYQRS